MSRVVITQRTLPPTDTGEQRYALDHRWFDLLARCGLTPVPVPNRPRAAVRTAEATEAAGLLLTGGDDLAAYGGPYPQRDETERDLLAWAMARDLPVLGVCRGMQVLVHALGGTLGPVDGHVATRHRVHTARGSAEVNSYHRLAPATVPRSLAVSAVDDAGSVEAVRHRDAPVVGQMWHPEREDPFTPDDLSELETIFGGVRCAV